MRDKIDLGVLLAQDLLQGQALPLDKDFVKETRVAMKLGEVSTVTSLSV